MKDIESLAYDLAKLYAKSKLDHALQSGHKFSDGPAPENVEELEYLLRDFVSAYDYFSGTDPTELERMLEQAHNGPIS